MSRIEEIKKRLEKLDYDLYHKPRDFWTGLKFTPDEAIEHRMETMRLIREWYDLTGEYWKHYDPDTHMSFQKRRYMEKHYPQTIKDELSKTKRV